MFRAAGPLLGGMKMSKEPAQDEVKKNVKAQRLQDFLQEHKVDAFMVNEVKDAQQAMVFTTNIMVEGQSLPVAILLDESVYVLLQVQVVSALLKDKQDVLLPYINQLNEDYRMLKYSINEAGDLLLSVCSVTEDEAFSPALILSVLDQVVLHLQDRYPEIMKKVWADSAK